MIAERNLAKKATTKGPTFYNSSHVFVFIFSSSNKSRFLIYIMQYYFVNTYTENITFLLWIFN